MQHKEKHPRNVPVQSSKEQGQLSLWCLGRRSHTDTEYIPCVHLHALDIQSPLRNGDRITLNEGPWHNSYYSDLNINVKQISMPKIN